MQPSNTSYDAVVIGSGHNGLVAAAYLAKAGQSVLVLEKSADFGGATTSKRVFPDHDALLSRYAYLVSLFPQAITADLELDFQTRRRRIASFTPWTDSAGRQRGLLLSNEDQGRSRDSMREMTGSDTAWNRYQQLLALESAFAKIAWPSLLEPAMSRESFQARFRTAEEKAAWRAFVERPLGEVLEEYADHDALRGLLLTDGKIGVFADAHHASLLQNRCFLYHVIGNETGEWWVPVGGMRSIPDSLVRRCRALGVTLAAESPAVRIETGPVRHRVHFESAGVARSVEATHVLVNAGPRALARLLGETWQPGPEDEGSAVKINMLMRRLPRLKAEGISPEDAFAGSFHIDEGYAQLQASFEAARAGRLPDPAPGEVYCHTLTDDSILAPELRAQGYQTLTLFGLDMPWRLFPADQNDARRGGGGPAVSRRARPALRRTFRRLPRPGSRRAAVRRGEDPARPPGRTRPRPGQHLPQRPVMVLHRRPRAGGHAGRGDAPSANPAGRLFGVPRRGGERRAGPQRRPRRPRPLTRIPLSCSDGLTN